MKNVPLGCYFGEPSCSTAAALAMMILAGCSAYLGPPARNGLFATSCHRDSGDGSGDVAGIEPTTTP